MRNRIVILIALGLGVGIIASFFIFKPQSTFQGKASSGSVSVQALLQQARGLEQKSDLLGLKEVYQKLINDFPAHKEVSVWQKNLDDTNIKSIFSSVIVPGLSQVYEVQPLDSLTKIAKEFNTTVDLLKQSNNLSSDRINPGRKLKIWTGKFSVLVDKSQNALILKCNDEILKTYTVATGTNNSTPAGTFKIVNKLTNPTWYKAGAVVPADSPENILGTRWLGFDIPSYGIHGTTDPMSIGKQATAGCVRMINTEVEELYALLPVGTEVVITD